MSKLISHRGGANEQAVQADACPSLAPPSVRVGQFYLDARRKRLHALNETARQLVREGLPIQRDDLVGQPLETLHGESVTTADLPLTRAWREGVQQDATFVLRRPGATPLILTWSAAPLGEVGKVEGVLGTVVVTTPEPDWQELAALAHDLRTPLQTLRLAVATIEALPMLHPEAERCTARVRSASDRAVALGLELLEWCKNPVQGAHRVNRSWLSLPQFLTGLAGEQFQAAQRKGLSLVVEIDAAAGWELNTDHGRLARLVGNLLANAVNYTPSGRITLRAEWREGAGLVLIVADTGAGFAPEDEESIFQPFARGKAGKEGDSHGSGLGLMVVDRLVHELELTLDVYSEYGAGSTFELCLPAKQLRREQG